MAYVVPPWKFLSNLIKDRQPASVESMVEESQHAALPQKRPTSDENTGTLCEDIYIQVE
jgi:hypothetical protein